MVGSSHLINLNGEENSQNPLDIMACVCYTMSSLLKGVSMRTLPDIIEKENDLLYKVEFGILTISEAASVLNQWLIEQGY